MPWLESASRAQLPRNSSSSDFSQSWLCLLQPDCRRSVFQSHWATGCPLRMVEEDVSSHWLQASRILNRLQGMPFGNFGQDFRNTALCRTFHLTAKPPESEFHVQLLLRLSLMICRLHDPEVTSSVALAARWAPGAVRTLPQDCKDYGAYATRMRHRSLLPHGDRDQAASRSLISPTARS
jgi:hypothetical protein